MFVAIFEGSKLAILRELNLNCLPVAQFFAAQSFKCSLTSFGVGTLLPHCAVYLTACLFESGISLSTIYGSLLLILSSVDAKLISIDSRLGVYFLVRTFGILIYMEITCSHLLGLRGKVASWLLLCFLESDLEFNTEGYLLFLLDIKTYSRSPREAGF